MTTRQHMESITQLHRNTSDENISSNTISGTYIIMMLANRVGRSFGVLCTLIALCLITNFLVKYLDVLRISYKNYKKSLTLKVKVARIKEV